MRGIERARHRVAHKDRFHWTSAGTFVPDNAKQFLPVRVFGLPLVAPGLVFIHSHERLVPFAEARKQFLIHTVGAGSQYEDHRSTSSVAVAISPTTSGASSFITGK